MMKHPGNPTTFRLFDRPSFLDGFSTIVDFRNLIERYHTDRTEIQADLNSLKSDWEVIGSDIGVAISKYESRRK